MVLIDKLRTSRNIGIAIGHRLFEIQFSSLADFLLVGLFPGRCGLHFYEFALLFWLFSGRVVFTTGTLS
jgi:hypothetical protein